MAGKLALCMGLNYRGTSAALSGCINDAENLREVLVGKLGFEDANVRMMTDDTAVKPTGRNMLEALVDLAKASQDPAVQEIWISYSGHGTYVEDTSGDEDDNRDEALVPLDYRANGLLPDDTLNHVIGLIRPGVRVVCVIDACHSETMFDLKYRYISGRKSVVENAGCKSRCYCLMISGCQDDDVSQDVYGLGDAKEFSGAMTTALLHVLKQFEYTVTCFQLLKFMRRFLKRRKLSQVPQITCNHRLTYATLFSCVDPKPFLLN